MTFGDRLTRLRKSRDLTQEQLAEKLNIGKSTIAMYESNKREPNSDTLVLMAEFFHCTIDYLLRGDIRPQNEIIDEEVNEFLMKINELGEREKEYLKGKVEDWIDMLKKMT